MDVDVAVADAVANAVSSQKCWLWGVQVEMVCAHVHYVCLFQVLDSYGSSDSLTGPGGRGGTGVGWDACLSYGDCTHSLFCGISFCVNFMMGTAFMGPRHKHLDSDDKLIQS